MALAFPASAHPGPTPAAVRQGYLDDPGFGRYFCDHMAVARWNAEAGWHDDALVPYAGFQMQPADAVLHYAQEIFEGLKAYRHPDGSVWLFRPDANGRRMVRSADRLVLPPLPVEDFVTSVRRLVEADHEWVPSKPETTLYLRPFMFASESFLGVRAAENVTYMVIGSPVGQFLSAGTQPVNIWITTTLSRAGNGGTGYAKCGGNYASSLVAKKEAYAQGCNDVLFTDAATHSLLEELSGMNVFLVTRDGRLLTPPTSTGTILEGITRDSILTVAPGLGLKVEERPIPVAEMLSGIASGEVAEAFACGTAAVITPIGAFRHSAGEARLGDTVGEQTLRIRNTILDIQFGHAADPYGWMQRVV